MKKDNRILLIKLFHYLIPYLNKISKYKNKIYSKIQIVTNKLKQKFNIENSLLQNFKKFLSKIKSKRTIKKKQNEHILKKQKQDSKKLISKDSELKNDSIENLYNLLEKYENFIKKDLTILMLQINAFIRHLKQEIIHNPSHGLERFNIELMEVTKIYHEAEVTFNRCANNYYNYQQKILKLSSEKQNKKIECHLKEVIKELKKASNTLDLNKNSDYCFVNEYVKNQNQKARSIN